MNLVASPNDEYYQPFTQSEVASSIPEVFERRTQRLGQRIAIQTQERSYTYASLTMLPIASPTRSLSSSAMDRIPSRSC